MSLSVHRRIPTLLQGPGCNLGTGRRLVVHNWADFQSVHGFRCYDNIPPNAKCQRVLVLDAWFFLEVSVRVGMCSNRLSVRPHLCEDRSILGRQYAQVSKGGSDRWSQPSVAHTLTSGLWRPIALSIVVSLNMKLSCKEVNTNTWCHTKSYKNIIWDGHLGYSAH